MGSAWQHSRPAWRTDPQVRACLVWYYASEEDTMATKNHAMQELRHLTEQKVRIPPSNEELRKGVNVLTTSDPKNPAPNPFVQARNPGAPHGNQHGSGIKDAGRRSE